MLKLQRKKVILNYISEEDERVVVAIEPLLSTEQLKEQGERNLRESRAFCERVMRIYSGGELVREYQQDELSLNALPLINPVFQEARDNQISAEELVLSLDGRIADDYETEKARRPPTNAWATLRFSHV
jgi:hypothetical protein